jgi:putative two-component system response regulator
LQVANERLEARLKEMKLGIANALEALLRERDEYSFLHASRVATHASRLAHSMGTNDEDREDLAIAATLHHLGDVSVPDEVLLKVGSPTTDERATYEAHSERGARILTIVPELRNVADLVRFHRENFDGSGSPRGLEGDQIPLACRIIRVADEYDLLTHPRDASTHINHDEAMRILGERAGTEFDPRVVKSMWQLCPNEIEPEDVEAGEMDALWLSNGPDNVESSILEPPFILTTGLLDHPTDWINKLES